MELKKEIRQTEELLSGMQATSEKYRLLKRLNFLIMKLNTIRNASIMFELPQQYEENLIDRFGSKRFSSPKG